MFPIYLKKYLINSYKFPVIVTQLILLDKDSAVNFKDFVF